MRPLSVRAPTWSRWKPRSGRPRPITSRPRTNWTPRASCSGATQASCRNATSRSCRCWSITGLPLIDQHLQLLDVALRHDAWVAPLQLALGVQFVLGLLVIGLGLPDLGFHLDHVGARTDKGRIDLGNLALRGLYGGLLLRTVEPEEDVPFFHGFADADVYF